MISIKDFIICLDSIRDRRHRYLGYRIDNDLFGTKMYCIGFWWLHVYWTFGDHV